MLRRSESRTDWAKVDAMTEEELEASIAADPDDTHEELDWSKVIKGLPPLPPAKKHISLRIDADVAASHQSRLNGRRLGLLGTAGDEDDQRRSENSSHWVCLLESAVEGRWPRMVLAWLVIVRGSSG